MRKKLLLALLFASACGVHSVAGQAPVYKLLYSPPPGAPVGYLGPMFEVKQGLFYVLSTWSTNTFGTSIFTITGTGTFKSIYSFPPYTSMVTLVQGTNGKLYVPGLLNVSPYNVYYSIDPSGKNLQQYLFPGQWGSVWRTTVAPPGELYDIVGRVQNSLTIFGFARISESGKITILHQFSGTDGFPNLYANMIYGPDGNFYGIGDQQQGGVSPNFIFRFTPSGAYSQILTFPTFLTGGGALPLVAGSDGNLYGSVSNGGTNKTGEIYQATLSGQFQVVASFPATGMSEPRSLMQAADGNLYGTTNFNQIFRYNLTTHALNTVYRMAADGSQGKCGCELVEGMDGKLYGVAPYGGINPGVGAVFSLNIGLPKPTPVISQMYPSSGPVGQKVILWGNYLLGASSVTFNGVPATSVLVTSVQSIQVTVPAGATTGPVSITTANGSFTTTQDFTVQ